ncbi:MAG: hypothetical protein HC925_00560 [Coleofasciculaceae cyanobacterium SM2_3_26]|nr:hypothetical protein [Coleofasciculaceae cyanobacterium SM2_3_26]
MKQKEYSQRIPGMRSNPSWGCQGHFLSSTISLALLKLLLELDMDDLRARTVEKLIDIVGIAGIAGKI